MNYPLVLDQRHCDGGRMQWGWRACLVHGWFLGSWNPLGRCINPNPTRRMWYQVSDQGDQGIMSFCEDEHCPCCDRGIYVFYVVWDQDQSWRKCVSDSREEELYRFGNMPLLHWFHHLCWGCWSQIPLFLGGLTEKDIMATLGDTTFIEDLKGWSGTSSSSREVTQSFQCTYDPEKSWEER